MKYMISTILLCMVVTIPLQLQAQISTSIAQKYTLFTVVKTMKCTPVSPGTDGSAQVWDFSNLSPLATNDTTKAKYLEHDASMPFANASIVRKMGTRYTFYEYTSAGVFELGTLDSTNNPPDTAAHNDSKQIMQHPITYTNMYTDTFTLDAGPTTTGGGNITDTVESYGKIILPNDTFENVIRMRITEEFSGTIQGVVTDIVKVSYQWYDQDHSTPLLRIDSTVTTVSGVPSTTTRETAYLLEEDPVTIADVSITRLPITAVFTGNELVLTGGTEEGHNYNLSLYTITGHKIFHTGFIAKGRQSFGINNEVQPGIYVLAVDDADNHGTIGILKLVKR